MTLLLRNKALGAAIIGFCCLAFGQEPPIVPLPNSGAGAVMGQPYTARQYRSGSTSPVSGSAEGLHTSQAIEVARDSMGRIRVETGADTADLKKVLVFDPAAKLITAWLEGNGAAHFATHIALTEAQVKQIEASQTPSQIMVHRATPINASEDLGVDTIDGIPVAGIRTFSDSRAQDAKDSDNKVTAVDLWFSTDLQLVVKKVIWKAGKVVETSGLKDIARSPDAALFQPPSDYPTNENTNGRFVGASMTVLAEVPIR